MLRGKQCVLTGNITLVSKQRKMRWKNTQVAKKTSWHTTPSGDTLQNDNNYNNNLQAASPAQWNWRWPLSLRAYACNDISVLSLECRADRPPSVSGMPMQSETKPGKQHYRVTCTDYIRSKSDIHIKIHILWNINASHE